MTSFEFIKPDSTFFEDVQRLHAANSATLGQFPRDAFLDRALAEEILGAIDSHILQGYVLFNKTLRRTITLTHLCVAKHSRGNGIAKQLVHELVRRFPTYRNISLHCRRDFDVWRMWPSLGFHVAGSKPGKSAEGHELTRFNLTIHSDPLLPFDHPDGTQTCVILDTNIVSDLINPASGGSEESLGLCADWLRPQIRLFRTPENLNEVSKTNDPLERAERWRKTLEFEAIEGNFNEFNQAHDNLLAILKTKNLTHDSADIRHLAWALSSNIPFFVTRDEGILRLADIVYDAFGLRIVRPSELIGRFEELRNEGSFQRRRLGGSELEVHRLNRFQDDLYEIFRHPARQETKSSFRDALVGLFSQPDAGECLQILDERAGTPLLLVVLDRRINHIVRIPFLRMSPTIASGRKAETLFRSIITTIVQRESKRDTAVVFEEDGLDDNLRAALSDLGFVGGPNKNQLTKVCLTHVGDTQEVTAKLKDFLSLAKLPLTPWNPIFECLASSCPEQAIQVEHLLSPLKLIGCGISTFIVPIKLDWAQGLFDCGLDGTRLWQADSGLVLNPESVYYRSVRPSPFRSGFGRILWYVSHERNQPKSMKIRAVSRLKHVEKGTAKRLYDSNKRFGIYQWDDVLKSANGKPLGEIMALRFDDTEGIANPIHWDAFQTILKKHNISTNLQSPVEISEACFVELYKLSSSSDL